MPQGSPMRQKSNASLASSVSPSRAPTSASPTADAVGADKTKNWISGAAGCVSKRARGQYDLNRAPISSSPSRSKFLSQSQSRKAFYPITARHEPRAPTVVVLPVLPNPITAMTLPIVSPPFPAMAHNIITLFERFSRFFCSNSVCFPPVTSRKQLYSERPALPSFRE
jgi:hypothetical protein